MWKPALIGNTLILDWNKALGAIANSKSIDYDNDNEHNTVEFKTPPGTSPVNESPTTSTAPSTSSRPIVALLIVWAMMLFGGLAAGRWIAEPNGETLSGIGRLGSSIVLVILGFVQWSKVGPKTRSYALLIAIGMLLGTVGDFFMAGQLRFLGLPNQALGGMGAFGLGHLFYMIGMAGLLKRFGPVNWSKLFSSFLVWQVIGLLAWIAIVYGATKNMELKWPALGYTLFLAGTAGVATAVASHRTGLWPLALGAALFLLSDLILGIGMFRGAIPFREAVWLNYGPGQMLIVISAWLVHRSDP